MEGSMIKMKRALISVSDKTGILELVKSLQKYDIEIISTGGTAKMLRDNNIPVKDVSEYTGFPEMLDGRVKTLHPKIHGGLLAVRSNQGHMQSLESHGIGLIDMVVVNLYPFEKTIAKPNVSIEEVIENIDIGGPSMLRSAAKNAGSVAVVCDPERYTQIIDELGKHNGSLPESLLRQLGIEAYKLTSHYDSVIHRYLKNHFYPEFHRGMPQEMDISFTKVQDLRYGENPHQKAAFYRDAGKLTGLSTIKQLWGKELSFNNILDLNAAVNIVQEFVLPAVVFVKHNNPCGAAENKSIYKAYTDAWQCDALSAFGGIVSLNREIDLRLAKLIAQSGFLECIICPRFAPDALALLKAKKNVRLLELPALTERVIQSDYKRVAGGLLVQDEDTALYDEKSFTVVTRKKPTKKEMDSLLFAWKVAKYVKSNAIVLVQDRRTVGIGAGQTSRVDSVFIATKKAGKSARASVLASDAFFPKEDGIKLAARFKVRAIIQPGGSIADEKIIAVANRYEIPMVFTGMRHFRH